MDISGICDVCKSAGELHTCMLCGRRVCPRCYLPAEGICIVCRGGRVISPATGKALK
ncbi:MAG: orotate phosphoribosyltransferase [Candidatus Altiarchaeota archaeon]|nr:orotate phosphoribosyltransferase [Candidatus Altiarchaeota archaeon]